MSPMAEGLNNSMENFWNETGRETQSPGKIASASATLSTTRP